MPITVLDAAGLSLFAVTGASKALDYGLGAGQAVILGAITGVGGGTLRDVLVRRIPAVLQSGLYAIPALIGAGITVAAVGVGVYGPIAAVAAATVCFLIRMLGVRYASTRPDPRPRRPDARAVGSCAHEERDRCCGLDGRALVDAVAGPDVFAASHLGGHRFAATAMVLPTGYVYGRLGSTSPRRSASLLRPVR